MDAGRITAVGTDVATRYVIGSWARWFHTYTAAQEASVPGYELAGKTGTAQKPDPKTGEVRPLSMKPSEVRDFLDARVATCVAAGIRRDRIAIDPGFAATQLARDTAADRPRRCVGLRFHWALGVINPK